MDDSILSALNRPAKPTMDDDVIENADFAEAANNPLAQVGLHVVQHAKLALVDEPLFPPLVLRGVLNLVGIEASTWLELPTIRFTAIVTLVDAKSKVEVGQALQGPTVVELTKATREMAKEWPFRCRVYFVFDGLVIKEAGTFKFRVDMGEEVDERFVGLSSGPPCCLSGDVEVTKAREPPKSTEPGTKPDEPDKPAEPHKPAESDKPAEPDKPTESTEPTR